MNLEKLYKMQEELDNHILQKHNIKMTKEELLDKTILALLVEVGELANTTRCFKHWSTKGMMDKEVVLEELSDVWHFYLSIGNQDKVKYEWEDAEFEGENNPLTNIFINIYYWIGRFEAEREYGGGIFKLDAYSMLGNWLQILSKKLGFTDEEVEQAYLKKHEENYRRQREGY